MSAETRGYSVRPAHSATILSRPQHLSGGGGGGAALSFSAASASPAAAAAREDPTVAVFRFDIVRAESLLLPAAAVATSTALKD